MQGLMYRLAELDADSAGLVRVIDYFDALVRHGADTASMLRASAALADCVVGIDISGWSGSSEPRRCDPRGRWSPQPRLAPSASKDVVVDDVVVGSVWIERSGASLPLDDMLVDRMALTAAIILQPRRVLTDAEHTRNLLFPMDELAVLTSCAALRIEPSTPVRVLVYTAGGGARLPLPGELAPGRSTEIEVDGDSLMLVAESFVPTPEFADVARSRSVQVGLSLASAASDANTLVGTAKFARSQASEPEPIGNADDLGALNLLIGGQSLAHAAIPDLVHAAELRDSEQGSELLATLRVYLRSGTLRAAAESMHLHHSSVAHRLTKLSRHLGFAVDAIENRARATALMMVIDTR
ncbi:helix-turn-helix domain-containing protein [Rhodococcus sp. NPDC019627]|uniref:helix-turn-helix domain-containing protein n=1 Tax=unclassified Rhodococcus (in: high G+C Gram-positive bacteria) TaxID=192944 RepID=UPI00340F4EFB